MKEGKTKENVKITPQDAINVLKQEEENRIQQCRKEIQGILEKYQCDVTAEVLLKEGRVIPRVIITPTR